MALSNSAIRRSLLSALLLLLTAIGGGHRDLTAGAPPPEEKPILIPLIITVNETLEVTGHWERPEYLRVEFNQPIDPATLNEQTFSVRSLPFPFPIHGTAIVDLIGINTVYFVPNKPFKPGLYGVIVSKGLRSTTGATLKNEARWSFQFYSGFKWSFYDTLLMARQTDCGGGLNEMQCDEGYAVTGLQAGMGPGFIRGLRVECSRMRMDGISPWSGIVPSNDDERFAVIQQTGGTRAGGVGNFQAGREHRAQCPAGYLGIHVDPIRAYFDDVEGKRVHRIYLKCARFNPNQAPYIFDEDIRSAGGIGPWADDIRPSSQQIPTFSDEGRDAVGLFSLGVMAGSDIDCINWIRGAPAEPDIFPR